MSSRAAQILLGTDSERFKVFDSKSIPTYEPYAKEGGERGGKRGGGPGLKRSSKRKSSWGSTSIIRGVSLSLVDSIVDAESYHHRMKIDIFMITQGMRSRDGAHNKFCLKEDAMALGVSDGDREGNVEQANLTNQISIIIL